MSDETTQKQVPILAALAQTTRLQILDRVAEGGAQGVPAGEIARSIQCPASTLSFHLKELSRTGVLEARHEGRFIHYSLQRPALKELAGYIAGLAGPVRPGRRRLADGERRVRKSRANESGQLSMFDE